MRDEWFEAWTFLTDIGWDFPCSRVLVWDANTPRLFWSRLDNHQLVVGLNYSQFEYAITLTCPVELRRLEEGRIPVREVLDKEMLWRVEITHEGVEYLGIWEGWPEGKGPLKDWHLSFDWLREVRFAPPSGDPVLLGVVRIKDNLTSFHPVPGVDKIQRELGSLCAYALDQLTDPALKIDELNAWMLELGPRIPIPRDFDIGSYLRRGVETEQDHENMLRFIEEMLAQFKDTRRAIADFAKAIE